ncbi:MAG: porin [Alphaproteobacteria bacterium]|nr:porin [Alphaproteobacteria bacterium]
MKKLLLLGGFVFLSAPVLANNFTIYEDKYHSVTVDGYLAGYTVYNDKSTEEQNKVDFAGYGEIHFTAEKKVNENNVFGAYVELETNPYHTNKSRVFEETYVYGEGNYGRFELGRAKNISRKMHISAPDVGLLDIDGSYSLDYLSTPDDFVFISSTAITTDKESNKINYVSPRYYGFQIAGSYIAGASDLNGDNSLDYDKFKRGYTIGLKYSYEDFGLTASVARFDDTNMPISQTDKRNEYSVGAKYYVKGLQLSASYKKIDEENIAGAKTQDGYALNYGLAYEFGPVEFSLSHHKSNVEGLLSSEFEDVLNLTILSGNYNISKGVDFATSVGRISYDAHKENSSTGLLCAIGFMITF